MIVKGSPQSSRSSWRMVPLGGLEFRSLDVQHIQMCVCADSRGMIASAKKTVHDALQRLDRCLVNNIQSCHKQRLDRCVASDSVSCQTHSDWIAWCECEHSDWIAALMCVCVGKQRLDRCVDALNLPAAPFSAKRIR